MSSLPIADLILAEMDQSARAGNVPRHRRLYEAIRSAILSRRLPVGSKLPSTRDLARDLGLSRNTVVTAFEQLLAEGYVSSRTGSGTFVADTLPEPATEELAPERQSRNSHHNGAIAPQHAPQEGTTAAVGATLSVRGRRVADHAAGHRYEIQPFVPGDDDFSVFPIKLWQRLQNKYWREARPELLDYGQNGGYLPLRRAIADYLRVSRSVRVTVDQVLITGGTQHSLDLCAQLLADAGDTAWVEDPCYWGAQRVFESRDLDLHPVRVDDEGMNPTAEDQHKPPRLIYLTPSHQYPKSVVMSLARRRLLLDIAARTGAWILEDDYDSEFRYTGRPLSSLQGLDTHDRVVYMGTFSKILYPGIKVGYMVVPPALVAPFRSALYDLQRPGQMMQQAALADFLEQGHFATHVRRIRQLYGQRRELLQRTLKPILGNAATLSKEESGLHLVIQLPPGTDDERLAQEAAEQGLQVRALSTYYLGAEKERGLVVGYAYVPTDKIAYYGRLLGNVVKAASAGRR
ncbi:PLP-dependent aminotransferase family protein [Niveibacterium microcysteis]|uniref:PLP-dependent aminotransferase family protein n=2 Tax=Rhodocyclaceae TaxID=75787 RepID=A0ABX7M165_9RHOO|nr:PLP-dependent aminotransferase family protein [Niveibacterium microcysteis]